MRYKLVAVLAMAAFAVIATAAGASAHTELESSSPDIGARVDQLPSVITLRFTEPVLLEGSSVTAATTTQQVRLSLMMGASPNELVATIPHALNGRGTVVFRWTAAAIDGHVSTGSVPVGVGVAVTSVSNKVGSASAHMIAVDRLFTITRLVGYTAMSLLVGAWMFIVLVWPAGAGVARSRVVMWACVAAGILSSAAGMCLEAATRSRRLAGAFEAEALRSMATSPFGRTWTARGLLFVLAVPLLLLLGRYGADVARSPFWVVTASAVGVGLLRTPGFVSHASEGNISAIGSVADLLHLIGVAAWLGGLVMLVAVVLPRRRVAELAEVVPRYSRLAFASIATVVVAGAVMSWELVGSFTSFADTQFGHVLALKLLLFVFVLGAALSSKRWVDQRLSVAVTFRGHASLVRPFVVSVATEAVLATGILAVASVLVATSPAR